MFHNHIQPSSMTYHYWPVSTRLIFLCIIVGFESNQDGSVSIVPMVPQDRELIVQFLTGAAYFYLLQSFQNGFWADPLPIPWSLGDSPPPLVGVTKLSAHVNVVLICRMGGAIPLYALMVCTGMKVNVYHPYFSVSGLINLCYRACYGIYALKDDFVMLHTLETWTVPEH